MVGDRLPAREDDRRNPRGAKRPAGGLPAFGHLEGKEKGQAGGEGGQVPSGGRRALRLPPRFGQRTGEEGIRPPAGRAGGKRLSLFSGPAEAFGTLLQDPVDPDGDMAPPGRPLPVDVEKGTPGITAPEPSQEGGGIERVNLDDVVGGVHRQFLVQKRVGRGEFLRSPVFFQADSL